MINGVNEESRFMIGGYEHSSQQRW